MPEVLALLVDDDATLYSPFAARAKETGWRLVISSAGDHAVELCRIIAPAAVLLRSRLDTADGLSICHALRMARETKGLPIIVLGREDGPGERAAAFAAGADEYVPQPVQLDELMARLRLFQRYPAAPRELAEGPILLDRMAHGVWVAGERVELTATEYRLLEALLVRPHVILSREELIESVWNRRGRVTCRTVDVYVQRLRRKLEVHGGAQTWIYSVRGFGYSLGKTA